MLKLGYLSVGFPSSGTEFLLLVCEEKGEDGLPNFERFYWGRWSRGVQRRLKHLPLFKHRFFLNSVIADKKSELQVGALYKSACLCKHM